MTRILAIVLLLFPLAAIAARDTQRVEDLEAESVMVYGPVEVEISQGEPSLLLVRGNPSGQEQQPFFVQGGTLVLGKSRQERPEADFSGVKFKLTLPELHSLDLQGSGDVYVKPFEVDDLSVALAGSGNIRLFALKGQSVNMTATGSGDIQLADLEAKSLEMTRAGSGDINLGQLAVKSVKASISGSGDISAEESASGVDLTMNIVGSGAMDFGKINANSVEINIVGSGTAIIGTSTTMAAVIMGSGDIYYRGSPEIESSILGSGDLHKRD